MAELASGAVHSLLSVIRNEAQLLGRVRGDLQFIREEMESMNSFLQHLARTTPPGGEHDEQVRTWMKQVRDLAYACSNCIDLYLQRGDPAVHGARGPLGYVWWIPWYLQKLYAQHRAAIQLRELKDRAQDVGKRRLRYDVKIPHKSGDKQTTTLGPITEAASSSQAAGEGYAGEEEKDDDSWASRDSLAFSEPRILEERTKELVDWLLHTDDKALSDYWETHIQDKFPSIVIAAPDEEEGADVAREALANPSVAARFELQLWINFPQLLPATPFYILLQIPQLQHLPVNMPWMVSLWEMIETLGMKLGEIMKKTEEHLQNLKKTEEHLQAADTERSPRVIPLEPLDILCDILQELLHKPVQSVDKDQIGEMNETAQKEPLSETVQSVDKENETAQKEPLSETVQSVDKDQIGEMNETAQKEPLSETVQSVGKDQIEKKKKINETAIKIKQHLESDKRRSWIGLKDYEYVRILQELIPQPKEDKPVKKATDKLGDDQIAKNIKEILQELLSMPQGDKSAVKEDTDKLGKDHIEEKIKETTEHIIDNMLRQKLLPKPKEEMDKLDENQMSYEKIEEIIQYIKRILKNIEEHLVVKEITEEIKKHLKDKRAIIVLDGINYAYNWWKTKEIFNELGWATGSAVIVTTKYTQGAYQYCNPTREPIIYSLVDFYYRKVLLCTSRRKNRDYNPYIFREILKLCEPHEFCMNMFVHVMYANPDKSKEELEKLRDTLVFGGSLDTNAKKMLMFSYSDLPRDSKTCFLYLAIFPRGHKIRRSSLVGRWVAEGLITKQDWPSSVHRAERCFDVLVNRWLVYPGDIGAAGKVKSCTVDNIVHEFITKIARKEHFVETRLSHQHAHHFSVLSDIRLRSSDNIEKFLRKLHKSPKLPLVKVLDLEGRQCFEKNQHYIKNICNQIFSPGSSSVCNQGRSQVGRGGVGASPSCIPSLSQPCATPPPPDTSTSTAMTQPLRTFSPGSTPICNKMLLLKYLRLRNTNVAKLSKEIEKNQHYIKNICNKMLLLKYLSLRHTNVTELPKEINNLHQLEILDIRHTHVMTRSATKDLMLLKLRRLLAGCIHPSPSSTDTTIRANESLFSAAQLPHRIEKMTNMEVLSHVEASHRGDELKDISKLWQLRKLGVVIHDKEAHLRKLVRVIGDLSESLQSLSINIKPLQDSSHGTPSITDINIENPPKLLERLRIHGMTSGWLLPLLVKRGDQLAKVTLHHTHLNQDNLKELGQLPKLRCVRLQHKSYTGSKLTFKNGEFLNLNYLVVEGSNMTEISFEDKAAPELKNAILSFANVISIIFGNTAAPQLEKIVMSSTSITGITFLNGAAPNLEEIVLSSTNITSITFEKGATPNLKKIVLSSTYVEFLSGINDLPELKELELNGSRIASALLSLFTNSNQIAKVTLRDTLLKQGDLQILAKQPNLRCLMLLVKSCDESQLSFNKDEFPKLYLIVVECAGITNISFSDGAAPMLEKIVWSFTKMESLPGIDNLPRLKELELNGALVPDQVVKAIEAHPNSPVLKHNIQQNEDKGTGSAAEVDHAA